MKEPEDHTQQVLSCMPKNIVCVGSNYFRLTGQIHSIMLCSLEQIHSIKAVVGFGASYSRWTGQIHHIALYFGAN